MIRILLTRGCIIFLFIIHQNAYSSTTERCQGWPKWFQGSCQRIYQIWTEGSPAVYISGYAWHNRYRYSTDRVKTYNEKAWGGGFGKELIDEHNNLHSLFAFGFLDSHKKLQPIVGYSYLKILTPDWPIKTGIGIAAVLTVRKDINKGRPIPGVLPWASIIVKKFSIAATYIPGHRDIGNVLFLITKYTF